MSLHRLPLVPALAIVLASAHSALAHEQAGVAGGLVTGLLHPISGLDHVTAMIAVGIWGAQLGAPAIWLLPITFPLVMAMGGVLGVLGVPLPAPEIVIASSALVLGCAVAARLRLPLAACAFVVGVFAIFHGHAHGAELPRAVNSLAYGVGFVWGTGILHLCGIGIGALTRYPVGERMIQGVGVMIGALGGYFLAIRLCGRAMRRTIGRIVVIAAASLLISAQSAEAHIVASRLGDFYAGALHPLTDLQDLILWAAIGLLAGSLGGSEGKALVLAFPLGLFAGFYLGRAFDIVSVGPLADAGMIVVLGLLLSAQLRIGAATLCALAVLLAVTRGAANAAGVGPETNRLLFAAGLAGAGYVAITLTTAITLAFRWPKSENPPAWRSVALRALGSWIAAIGLMMGALTLAP